MAKILLFVSDGSQFTFELGGNPLAHLSSMQWRTQEFCSGGSTDSFEDRGQRERGSGDVSLLVRGSGGTCNLVRKISFHIVKFS